MYSVNVSWFFTMSVSTFGNLRIEAYLQLPAAYRSLSRPSSAPDAKAFTLCSYSLELPSEFYSAVLLNCLSFIEQFVLVFSFRSKKVWSFLRFLPSGWDLFQNLTFGNCSSLPKFFGKTYSNLFCLLKCVLFYLFVSTHFTSLFGFQWTFSLIGLLLTLLVKLYQLLAVRPSGLVGSSGLEPPTSRLSGARSNHLSYEPI